MSFLISGALSGTPPFTPPSGGEGSWNLWSIDGGGLVCKIETSTDGSVIIISDSSPSYILKTENADWVPTYTSDISTLAYTQKAALSFQRPFECKQAQTDPNRIYLVAGGYVFRSTDQGSTWVNTNTLPGGGFSQDLTNGQSVSPYGIATSSYTDAGATNYKHVRQNIGIDPNNEDVLYVWKGGLQGVFFSSDAGSTFTKVTSIGNGGAWGGTIAFDPTSTTNVGGQTRSAIIYISSVNYGVYRSTDGGQNFSLISNGTDQKIVTMAECASWSGAGLPSSITDKRYICTESTMGVISNSHKTWQWDAGTSSFTNILTSDILSCAHDPGVPGRWVFNPYQVTTQTLDNCSTYVYVNSDWPVKFPTVATSDVAWLTYYFTGSHAYLTFAGGQFSRYWNRGTFNGYIDNGSGGNGNTLTVTSAVGTTPAVGETIATGTYGECVNGTMIVSGSYPTFTVNLAAQTVGSSGSPATFTRSANKFWGVTGDGIFWSNVRTDTTANTTHIKTKGQQELIAANIRIVPDVGVFLGNYDHAWLGPITDPTANPTTDPYQSGVLNRGCDLDYYSGNHNFIVIASKNQAYKDPATNAPVRQLKYSSDGGGTWTGITNEWMPNNQWQSVGVCDENNWVVAGVDGYSPHYTTDKGTTWSTCQINTGGDMPTTGWHRNGAQVAENSGIICVDKVNSSIVYLSNRNSGIFKSTDSGHTFTLIPQTAVPPFTNCGYKRKLYTSWYRYDLYESGWTSDIWFLPLSTSGYLWHSIDGGVTWTSNLFAVWGDFNFGVEPSVGAYPQVFAIYDPAGVNLVLRSDDYAVTWNQLEETNFQGGIIQGACNYCVSICGDPFVWGRCYHSNSAGPFGYWTPA